MGVAAGARDFQSRILDGGKMGAARDEGDIGPCLAQRRAESPTDPAGADNRNTHEFSPHLNASPERLLGLELPPRVDISNFSTHARTRVTSPLVGEVGSHR
jgi:hypothetical protein